METKLTPDEAKAALGIGNHLLQGLMPQLPPEPTQEALGSMESSQPTPSLPQQTPVDTEAFKEIIDDAKTELREVIKIEVAKIKDTIEEALKDE